MLPVLVFVWCGQFPGGGTDIVKLPKLLDKESEGINQIDRK
jgi:hypothetical protein